MTTCEFMIVQGQDCWLELVLPLELDEGDVITATFAQDDKIVLEYDYNTDPVSADAAADGEILLDQTDPCSIQVHMLQADTLRLERGDVEMQIRVVTDDGADAFLPSFGTVERTMRGGELTI